VRRLLIYDHRMALAAQRAQHMGWVVGSDQWAVVSGQWSVVSGQWSVVSGQWSVVSGQWLVVHGHGGKDAISQ
jgi:hypothetical protein